MQKHKKTIVKIITVSKTFMFNMIDYNTHDESLNLIIREEMSILLQNNAQLMFKYVVKADKTDWGIYKKENNIKNRQETFERSTMNYCTF